VLTAQAVFLLERGQTDRQTNKQTDATERPIHASGYTRGSAVADRPRRATLFAN